MKREVIIEYDVDHGLTIPVNLSMPVASNVIGELIRCRDCIKKRICSNYRYAQVEEGFCAWAERKEE